MHYSLQTDVILDSTLEESFAFFADAGNLESITPPELRFSIKTPLPIEMRQGAHIEYRLSLFGVPFGWLTEISVWEPGVRFVDQQIRGPFASWVHEHRFEALSGGRTRIRDDVRYSLPLGSLGRLAHPIVRKRLDRIFSYREESVTRLLHQSARLEP